MTSWDNDERPSDSKKVKHQAPQQYTDRPQVVLINLEVYGLTSEWLTYKFFVSFHMQTTAS